MFAEQSGCYLQTGTTTLRSFIQELYLQPISSLILPTMITFPTGRSSSQFVLRFSWPKNLILSPLYSLPPVWLWKSTLAIKASQWAAWAAQWRNAMTEHPPSGTRDTPSIRNTIKTASENSLVHPHMDLPGVGRASFWDWRKIEKAEVIQQACNWPAEGHQRSSTLWKRHRASWYLHWSAVLQQGCREQAWVSLAHLPTSYSRHFCAFTSFWSQLTSYTLKSWITATSNNDSHFLGFFFIGTIIWPCTFRCSVSVI